MYEDLKKVLKEFDFTLVNPLVVEKTLKCNDIVAIDSKDSIELRVDSNSQNKVLEILENEGYETNPKLGKLNIPSIGKQVITPGLKKITVYKNS